MVGWVEKAIDVLTQAALEGIDCRGIWGEGVRIVGRHLFGIVWADAQHVLRVVAGSTEGHMVWPVCRGMCLVKGYVGWIR